MTAYSARGPRPRPHKATWPTQCQPHPWKLMSTLCSHSSAPSEGSAMAWEAGDARQPSTVRWGTRVGLSYTLVPQPNTLPPPQTPQGHQQTQPSVCVVRGWPDPARAPAPHMASLAVNLLGLVRAQPELLPLPMRQRVRRGEAGCIGCGRAPPPPVCRRCAAPRAARAARPHRPCLWPAQPSYIRGPALPGTPVCTAGLADGVPACLRKT